MKRIKKYLCIAVTLAVRLALTGMAAFGSMLFFSNAAYAERGYHAIGGEWVAVILIGAAVWALTGIAGREFLREIESEVKAK